MNIFSVFKIIFKHSKWSAMFVIVGHVFLGLVVPAAVWSLQNFIDSIVLFVSGNQSDVGTLVLAVLIYIALMLLPSIITFFVDLGRNSMDRSLYKKFDSAYMSKIVSLKYEQIESREINDVIRKASDPKRVIDILFTQSLVLTSSTISFVGVFIYLVSVNLWFSLPILVFGLFKILTNFKNKKRKIKLRDDTVEFDRSASAINSLITNYKTQQEMRVFKFFDFMKKDTLTMQKK